MQQFWTTAQLKARGRSERQLRAALVCGAVVPVRKGVVAAPKTSAALRRAVRVGGVLTGVSAAREMGMWTPPDPAADAGPWNPTEPPPDRLHVAAARRDHRLRDPDDADEPLGDRRDVVVHRVPPDRILAARRSGIAPVLMVLEHVFLVLAPERAIAVLDSALHERHLLTTDLAALALLLPPRLRPLLQQVECRAESGLESIARVLLRQAGLRVDVLVGIRGVGSVDLVVEGRLILELDGRAYHSDEKAFARDRQRDLVATTARYRVLRFTWSQVLFHWPDVERAVFTALAVR